MYKFRDALGRPAKITAGCKILWVKDLGGPDKGRITIWHALRPEKGLSSNIFEWSGFSSREILFIQTGKAFKEFAEVMAEFHGLATKVIRDSGGEVFIDFVEPPP